MRWRGRPLLLFIKTQDMETSEIHGLYILIIVQVAIVLVYGGYLMAGRIRELHQANRLMSEHLITVSRHKTELTHSNFSIVDEICCVVYEWKGHKRGKEMIDKHMRNTVNEYRPQGGCVIPLTQFYSRYGLEIIPSHLGNLFNHSEHILSQYLYAGFSTKSICLLLGISEDALYVRKCRLRSKINRVLDTEEKTTVLERLKLYDSSGTRIKAASGTEEKAM